MIVMIIAATTTVLALIIAIVMLITRDVLVTVVVIIFITVVAGLRYCSNSYISLIISLNVFCYFLLSLQHLLGSKFKTTTLITRLKILIKLLLPLSLSLLASFLNLMSP